MKKITALIVVVLLVFLLSGCENVFSTSIARWAARADYGDLSKLSYVDAVALYDQALANNNAKLAQSLVPVFVKFLENTQPTDADYTSKGKQLFDVVFLASNLTTAYNTLFISFISGSTLDEQFLTTIAEKFQQLIVWNNTYSDAMMLCLEPELFDVLDVNALALAAFALALDVGHDLNLNILDPTSITDPDDIQRLEDSAQFQVVLTIINLLSGVNPETYPFVGAFDQFFDGITDLMD